ncbi:MAG: MBL fold metallo-hydrolase [Calditrichaeota bacterium]|nr:MAG: MBL fold metallo-hydrolase [Calditrichota bacterium]
MKPFAYFLLIVFLLIGTGFIFSQQDWDSVKITSQPVAGKVYMLKGRGGNIGVSAGEDGILIVDDQFAPLAEKIRAALKHLNHGPLRFVLNTHWHGDHTGGNPIFGKEATIIAHTNVRKRLIAGRKKSANGREIPPAPKQAWPIITFDQSVSIHFNGEEIKVMHYPHGHTDGDAVIYFTQSNVVHMGDDFFAGRFPFVDLASGGDVEGLIRNVRQVIEKLPQDVKVIPGHGDLSTLEDLKSFHQMLVSTTNHVREQMKAGKTLEQIKAAGLPEKWKSWGSGFISTDRWIETIYKSLSQQKMG